MTRTNLITNPSFKTNTTGWSATGAGTTISRVTSEYFVGSSSLQVTKAAVSDSGVVTSSRVSVTQLLPYSVSCYVKIPVDQEVGSLAINIAWYTATTGGSLISTSTGSPRELSVSTITDGGWVRIAETFTAPSTAVAALIYIVQPTAGTASKTFLLDAVLLEQSAYVNNYFDDISQAEENRIAALALSPLPQPHLTGLKLQADISLNDFVFNTVDEFGVIWIVTEIDGWWTLPDPEVPEIDKGWGDGSYDAKGKYQARQMEIQGVFLCPNPSLVAEARNRLVKAINLVYNGGWLKTSENPVRASFVRLSGPVQISTVNARGRTEFSIGLRAADPIKYEWYGPEVDGYRTEIVLAENASTSETGLATITNTGNYSVGVILEVVGPIVGPAVIYNSSTDQQILITGSLRGDTTVNVSNKQLTDDVATITTDATHGILAGDTVTVAGVDATFDGEFVVLSVPTTTTFTYALEDSNVASTPDTGTVSYSADVLEIDTYDRQVFLNGLYTGARNKLEVLVDWIKLAPGQNDIEFYDNGAANSTATMTVYYRSGWLA